MVRIADNGLLALNDMSVALGSRLGPYEIVSRIGAGGMGEVFKARDTRLDRSVAIKVLSSEFARNAQLKTRFEREAKTISQLQHPNICTLFDVGDENGTSFLVMELLEGEALADRLTRGPLPIEDVIRYGIQIAEALDRAHRQGIVHRDLKPGNVMIAKTGAKLLDFGLAKPAVLLTTSDSSLISATEHKPLTQEGTIVGTFQYMSPEQLDGADIDARSDIFALGALLYEMATGQRAFEGKTRSSLIAAIVSSQPKPLTQLQPLTPPALEHVIQRCLEKDPSDRWQSARDIAEELKWLGSKGSAAGVAAPVAVLRKSRERVAWIVGFAALAGLAVVAAALFLRPPQRRVVTELNAPPGARFAFESSTVALAPDGQSIAFVAMAKDGRQFLWVRPFASSVAQMLTGTEGAQFPFWSPDSKHIAFFADGKLKRIEAAGGPIERLAEASSGRGGSWGKRGVIVFSPSPGDPIVRVSESGGDVTEVTALSRSANDTSHRFPYFLPDGEHFLFYAQGPSAERPNVFVGSTKGMPAKKVVTADGNAVYSSSGQILFVRDRVLRSRKFNAKKFEFEEEFRTIAESVQVSPSLNFCNVSVSDNGTLAYVTGDSATTSRLVLTDRKGVELSAHPAAGEYFDPRLSPDGKRVVHAVAASGHNNLYVYDITRRVSSRFTFGRVNEWAPVWSADGKTIIFTSFEASTGDLHAKRATGTEAEVKLVSDGRRKVATATSLDGRYMLYHAMTPKTSWDIDVYSFADKKSRPFLKTPYAESQGAFSPDGRWVVYVSLESGVAEVYVREFENPEGGGKWQISSGGGTMPSWSADGKEIHFVAGDGRLMAAAVTAGEAFDTGTPVPILSRRLRSFPGMTRRQYDLSRDGKIFVFNEASGEQQAPVSVTIIQNWRR